MDTVVDGKIAKRVGDTIVFMTGEEFYGELKRIVWSQAGRYGVKLTEEQCHDVATHLWERTGEFKVAPGSHLGGWLAMLAGGYVRNKIRKTRLQAKTVPVADDFDCPQNEKRDCEVGRQKMVEIVEKAVGDGVVTIDEYKSVLAYFGHGIRIETEVNRTTAYMRLQEVLKRLRVVAASFE